MPGRAIFKLVYEESDSGGSRSLTVRVMDVLKSCRPQEIPYCITDALIAAAKGDIEHALLFCGAYAYRAQKIETVKEVIASLMNPCV